MAEMWSFNTTVRNPERMENMLRVLAELEGVPFDAVGQKRFFGLLIKKRLYKPEKNTLEEPDLIAIVHEDETGDDIEDDVVERIVAKWDDKDVDASARGRTPAGILNRFGLCIARQANGPVVITELGKKWLTHEIGDEELFTKFLLKWQYPNQIEAGYSDFNIKPFIGTLKLIDTVNKKWEALGNKPVGLSKVEYQLFVPTLKNSADIETYADKIIAFRTEKEARTGKDKTDFVKDYANERIREVTPEATTTKLKTIASDLRDYTDSSIRYFRVSGLISLRGNDTHIDIAHDKEVEVASILEKMSASAETFTSDDEYFALISNPELPVLPWENEDDLRKVSEQLTRVLSDEGGAPYVLTEEISAQPPKVQVALLEEKLNVVRTNKLRGLKHDLTVLDECISKLEGLTSKGYETITARPSLDFEWYVSRALMVLNDAEDIIPSYKLGDDGIPTGFRANTSDIECHYGNFGMTVEVTLLLGRDQWYAEGQPVMRHLRDFEDKIEHENAYCIFVAPYIHRDTLNTFWTGVKFQYEGKKQSIIPMTLDQFVLFLKQARAKIADGTLNHTDIQRLLNDIVTKAEDYNVATEWTDTFGEVINNWTTA